MNPPLSNPPPIKRLGQFGRQSFQKTPGRKIKDSLAAKDQQLAAKDQQLAAKDQQLAEFKNRLSRSRQTNKKQKAVLEKRVQELETLINSNSQKIKQILKEYAIKRRDSERRETAMSETAISVDYRL